MFQRNVLPSYSGLKSNPSKYHIFVRHACFVCISPRNRNGVIGCMLIVFCFTDSLCFKSLKQILQVKINLHLSLRLIIMPERHRINLNLRIRWSFTFCHFTQEEGHNIHWMRSWVGSTDNLDFLTDIEILKSSSP